MAAAPGADRGRAGGPLMLLMISPPAGGLDGARGTAVAAPALRPALRLCPRPPSTSPSPGVSGGGPPTQSSRAMPGGLPGAGRDGWRWTLSHFVTLSLGHPSQLRGSPARRLRISNPSDFYRLTSETNRTYESEQECENIRGCPGPEQFQIQS